MQISLIIPMYNVEKYIIRCLDSIFSQPLDECEVILIDDGSRDHTVERVRDYLAACPQKERASLILKENSGASETRNRGLFEAQGEYIVFIDADDCLAESAMDIFRRAIREQDVDLYVFGFFISDLRETVKAGLTEKERFIVREKDSLSCLRAYFEKTGYLSTWQPWAKIFRKSLIDRYQAAFDGRLFSSNDFDFFFRYFRHVLSAAFDPAPVYVYTADRPGSISSSKLLPRAVSNMRATRRLFEDIRRRDPEERTLLDFVSRQYLGTFELCASMNPVEIRRIRRLNCRFQDVYCFSRQPLAMFKRFLYASLGFRAGAKAVVFVRNAEYTLKGKRGQLSLPQGKKEGREDL